MRWRHYIDRAERFDQRLKDFQEEIFDFAEDLKKTNQVYQTLAAESAQELYSAVYKLKELSDTIKHDYMKNPTHYKFRNNKNPYENEQ